MENNTCCRLLQGVNEASFFMQDLKLYLDTHPNDVTAIEMFHEAAKQYETCKEAFEKNCYPLTAAGSSSEECWDWPKGVWPPERM